MPQAATLETLRTNLVPAPRAEATPHPVALPHQGTDLETLLADASPRELRQMVRELSDELAWALHTFAPAHRLIPSSGPDTDDQVILYKAAPFTDHMHPTQTTAAQARAFANAHRQDLVAFADGFTLACWASGSFHADTALDHA